MVPWLPATRPKGLSRVSTRRWLVSVSPHHGGAAGGIVGEGGTQDPFGDAKGHRRHEAFVEGEGLAGQQRSR
jgi:hypothetical protein